MKQTISWWCYNNSGLSPEELVRVTKEIGYAGFDLVPQEYWKLVRDNGLELAAVDGHKSIQSGLNRRENHARIHQELLDKIALAEKWGVHSLIVFSGSREGQPDSIGAEITADGLRMVAKSAEDAGVMLILELLNSKVDHPDYQADHTAWGVEVVKAVDSPAVRLLYDIYHMQIMEGDLIRTIQTYHPWFGHYHTAGNPGRNEIDERQEINYPAVIRAIKDTGFEGYIAQEFVPLGDPIIAMRQAFEICK
ncbi:MAG TPA: TIM barrel protein [Anaerolineaceae bacterium]